MPPKNSGEKHKGEKKRNLIQALSALITNGYLWGFIKADIFKGGTKHICVPGLNCYSCPGALGSCPIGSLQAVLGARGKNVSYYVVGFLLLFGVLFGRLICGFLCPFGWIQDLLYKIKSKKIKVPFKLDKVLRYLKYVMLLVPVILLPMYMTDMFGIGAPYFCKYICPVGALEGGIPLVAGNQALRDAVGFLFSWKMFLLALTLVLSVLIYRPFCKYICPLGAFYGLFNKLSFYKMHVDLSSCIGCHKCEKACKMNVPVLKNINSPECIRCNACKNVCPKDCITSQFIFTQAKKHTKNEQA